MLWLRMIWCRLMHREGWSLYRGFTPRQHWLHCNVCGRFWGDKSTWRQTYGIRFADATEAEQDAGRMTFGLRPDRLMEKDR